MQSMKAFVIRETDFFLVNNNISAPFVWFFQIKRIIKVAFSDKRNNAAHLNEGGHVSWCAITRSYIPERPLR